VLHPNVILFRDSQVVATLALGYNFFLDLTLIEGFHKKLWASKVKGVLILRISKFLGQNDMWSGTENIIKGKVVVSLKSEPW
jgi:hypothetical protein